MLTRIRCTDPNQFNHLLDQASKRVDHTLFILFTGSKNPSNGLSWCPDCVRAEPLINQALSKMDKNVILLECDVDREPYRTQTYPYRVDPRINLRCVPTLMKWENGKCVLRLDDIQCQNPDAVQELLES